MGHIKPLVFVAMPFGKRKDISTGVEIDFDHIYTSAIQPAAESLGLEVMRGDEERTGGIIMRPVFERLLLAEIVIADLTMQNPNVFYELGVRHAARPRSTILMYAQNARLPFDVAMIRAVPYDLEDGDLTDASKQNLTDALTEKLKEAVHKSEDVDSPLSQLIPEFPYISLPHEVTDTFKDRVVGISTVKDQIFRACAVKNEVAALEILQNIEAEVGALTDTNAELYVDLLLAYRDVKSWGDMVRVCELFPPETARQIPAIIEQRAFALNRRNDEGDRDVALRNLETLISKYGDNPETCGLIGRIYKDRYEEAAGLCLDDDDLEPALLMLRADDALPRGYLGNAIEWYERGFLSDPRDFYPGINEATLRHIRGDDEDQEKLNDLLPALSFTVARLGGMKSKDYWVVATTLELSVLREHWDIVERTLEKILALGAYDWMLETTAKNLHLIKEVRKLRGEDISQLHPIILRLNPTA